MSEEQLHYVPGTGVDVGTSFLQVARQKSDGTVEFLAERDAFYAMVPTTPVNAKLIEKSLKQRNAFTLKKDGKFYVVGQQAIDVANEKGDTVSRPLKRGVLSVAQVDSFGMLAVVIEALVGRAQQQGEICVYCYPSPPVEAEFDVIYHQKRLNEIFKNLGYSPKGILEAEALVYSELMDEELTGVAVSCGAGMHNVAVSHLGEIITSFSIAQGGDWIDERVARLFARSESIIQAEKEGSLDLLDAAANIPADTHNYEEVLNIHKALIEYYDELINYVVAMLEKKLSKTERIPKFKKPVSFVLSGGTSMPNGYLEKFQLAASSRKFPFEIGEIKRATNPLTAVANGCLIAAQLED